MKLAHLTRPFRRAAAAATVALALAGCASTSAPGDTDVAVSDPLEIPNRFVFAANEAVDILLIEPVTQVYVGLVPDPVREAIHNFIQNLMSPIYVANNLLQGDWEGAKLQTGRFFTNTTIGGAGFFDVATGYGMPEQQRDFGQTLGKWGLGSGPYLVLPLIGPSNIRDGIGYGVDSFADPFSNWALATDNNGLLWGRTITSGIDRRSQLLGAVADLRRNSLDYYATVRSLSAQQRAAAIRGTAANAEPQFPDFDTPAK